MGKYKTRRLEDNMTKIYKELTEDQKKRGVTFSSTLVESNRNEGSSDTIHEIIGSDHRKKARLLNDSFFCLPGSPYKYNIIRE